MPESQPDCPCPSDEASRPVSLLVLLPVAALVVILVAAAIFSGSDPVASEKEHIAQAVAEGRYDEALLLAETALSMRPQSAPARTQVRWVVASELADLMDRQQYDVAVVRLADHRQRHPWLADDADHLLRELRLTQARDLMTAGRPGEAEALLVAALEQWPEDGELRRMVVETLPLEEGGPGWRTLQRAARELLELEPELDDTTFQVLLRGLFWQAVDDPATIALRRRLMAHDAEAVIAEARKRRDDPAYRAHAEAILATTAVDP